MTDREPATTTTSTPTVTAVTPVDTTIRTGDLAHPEIRRVLVGEEELTVAWADTPPVRARGLMEVTDLGDLDGMLFDLGSERVPTFTMRNTLIPLDIYFFDAAGAPVGRGEMVPCQGEPCASYTIEARARYALEVPAGFDIDPDARLHVDAFGS